MEVVVELRGGTNGHDGSEADGAGQGRVVEKRVVEGRHSYIDTEYMKEVERVCLGDVRVQEQVRGLGLPEGAEVVVEPWAYATDGVEDMAGRVTMVCVTLSLNFLRCCRGFSRGGEG